MTPVALTIAGSDPSGGAGLQADLKTFHQFGVYGMSVVTLLTVQNTQRVSAVEVQTPDFIRAQLEAVRADIPPHAAKTGALGSSAVITAVAEAAAEFSHPLIVDPVMYSKHGDPLLPTDATGLLREALLPHALLVTPNIPEAAALGDCAIESVADIPRAAERIAACGVANVLIKGGALADSADDWLWSDGALTQLPAERVATQSTHGTGCVLSAAITAGIALGRPLSDAVASAKAFVQRAIASHPDLGQGHGPINMHAAT